jgi:rhamnosyltransferase
MNILIILASYNGVKYIKEQVDSILTQEGVNVTLKIFDDGSKDGTVDLVSSWKEHELSLIHI